MKVNFELYNKQKKGNNNISSRNISFNGYSLKKGNYGEKVFEFNYPYDSKKYDCYLEVCSVETDENGNYIIVEGLKNNYDPDGFLKLNPDCNKIDLAKTFCLRDDEPFAYHYALVPKGANRKDPNVFPIYKIDAGDNIREQIPALLRQFVSELDFKFRAVQAALSRNARNIKLALRLRCFFCDKGWRGEDKSQLIYAFQLLFKLLIGINRKAGSRDRQLAAPMDACL